MPTFGSESMLPTGGSGGIKRHSIPEKGVLRIAVVRPSFAQVPVHWVRTEEKSQAQARGTPYRCTGEGCVLCEGADGSQGVIGPIAYLTQIWTAAAGDGVYTPGTLGLAPTAFNSINRLAQAEGGADRLVGAELELRREYISRSSY